MVVVVVSAWAGQAVEPQILLRINKVSIVKGELLPHFSSVSRCKVVTWHSSR